MPVGLKKENPMTITRVFLLLVFLMGMEAAAHAFTTDQQEDICTRADVIFCENWEDRLTGFVSPGSAQQVDLRRPKYKNLGWDSPFSSGQAGVATTVARDGTKSFQTHWPEGRWCCSGYLLTIFPAGYRDLYFRVYTYFSTNYKVSPIGNRQFALNPGNPDASVVGSLHDFTNVFGQMAPEHKATRQQLDWIQLPQNVGSPVSFTRDTWICQEIHVRQSSAANVANGLVEGWIDGVQKWNYSNVIVLDYVQPITQLWFDGRYNCEEPEVNNQCGGTGSGGYHPDMSRWHDNFVIATQRIGCLGSAPSDTKPPLAPSNLRVSSLWNQFLKVFWTLASPLG
jgi:hypothetical protein